MQTVQKNESQTYTLTQQQLEQLLRSLPQQTQSNSASNIEIDNEIDHTFAGISTSLSATIDKHEQVLGLGATDHMSHNSLDTFDQIVRPKQKPKVKLPNGQATSIAHMGNVKLSNKLELKDVLQISSFKFNLLSVFNWLRTVSAMSFLIQSFV